MKAAVIESFDKLVYPLILGSIHALFLDSVGLQSIILGCLEVTYLTFKIYSLRSSVPASKLKVSLMAFLSLLRMGFISTFYLYERNGYP